MDDESVRSAVIAAAIGAFLVGVAFGYLVRAVQYEIRRTRRLWSRNRKGMALLGQVALGMLGLVAVVGFVLVRMVMAA